MTQNKIDKVYAKCQHRNQAFLRGIVLYRQHRLGSHLDWVQVFEEVAEAAVRFAEQFVNTPTMFHTVYKSNT